MSIKKAGRLALVTAGGVAGARVSVAVSQPLVGRALAAVGIAQKLPGAVSAFLGDAVMVGHVVAGLAAGAWGARKLGL